MYTCTKCNRNYETRNKLFRHLDFCLSRDSYSQCSKKCNSCGKEKLEDEFSKSQFYRVASYRRRCIVCADSKNDGRNAKSLNCDSQKRWDVIQERRRNKKAVKTEERRIRKEEKAEQERIRLEKIAEQERIRAKEEARIAEVLRQEKLQKMKQIGERLEKKRKTDLTSWNQRKRSLLTTNHRFEIEIELLVSEGEYTSGFRVLNKNQDEISMLKEKVKKIQGEIRELSLKILDNTF